jgi:hypothetical protein
VLRIPHGWRVMLGFMGWQMMLTSVRFFTFGGRVSKPEATSRTHPSKMTENAASMLLHRSSLHFDGLRKVIQV